MERWEQEEMLQREWLAFEARQEMARFSSCRCCLLSFPSEVLLAFFGNDANQAHQARCRQVWGMGRCHGGRTRLGGESVRDRHHALPR